MGFCSKLRVSHDGEEDRISNLPDSIITRILSLLTAKYAVLTSVLSSRWKHHWTTIDSFDFNDHILCHLTQANGNPRGFMVFFERVLQRWDAANIKKFRLSWHRSMDVHCLRAFISFTVSRNVQELELDIPFRQVAVELPQEFFVSKSLEKLKVMADYLFYVPLLMDYFPSLKSLHVTFMYPDHPNLNSCQKLLCRCPQLEELVMGVISNYEKDILYKISGNSIKRLTLMFHAKSNQGNKHRFEIIAPVLENLCIMDDTSQFSLLGSFPQLKKVAIDLRNIEIYERSLYQMDRAVEILSGVANTKYLSLSLAATLVLRLQIENKDGIRKYSKPLNWTPCDLEKIPVCLLQKMKLIRIKSFRGQYVETNVIKFLLWHSKVLQKMTIHSVEADMEHKFSKRILKLPS